MKKLLILSVLILCLVMMITSCKDNVNSENTQGTENGNPTPVTDNVESNLNMLVSTINKYETMEKLIPAGDIDVDMNQIAKELSKISMQGSANLSAEDMWGKESINCSFAIKDNTFYTQTEYEYPDDKYSSGIKGKLFDSMDLIFTGWSEDDYNGFQLDVEGSRVINFELVYAIYMDCLEESLKDGIGELSINPADIRLPKITAENITYSEGKYIINKSFISDAIVMTIDAMIDSAKNNGIAIESEDEYDEMKEDIKTLFDSIDLEIYYLIELESIKGYGMSMYAEAEDIEKALDIDAKELGMNYIKASYETSDKGKKLYIEYEDYQSKYANKISVSEEYIFSDEAVCGFNIVYDVDMRQDKFMTEDDYFYEIYREKRVTITKQSGNITLDISKLGKENATVIKVESSSLSDVNSDVRYKDYGSSMESYTERSISEDTTSFEIKAMGKNELSINMTQNTSYKMYDDVSNNLQSYEDSFKIVGTVNYTTENVYIPEVPKRVDEYLEYLINEAIAWN